MGFFLLLGGEIILLLQMRDAANGGKLEIFCMNRKKSCFEHGAGSVHNTDHPCSVIAAGKAEM